MLEISIIQPFKLAWRVEQIQDDESVIGVGVSPKDAEKTRLRLVKENLLHPDRKPMKTNNYVFFPLIESSSVHSVLNDISFQIQNKNFPKRLELDSLTVSLQKEFPDFDPQKVSLKFDQVGNIAILKINTTHTTLSFRKLVGDLILSRHPRLKTVLNKADIVEGSERVYPTEYLAGDKIWQTWHREYEILIYVDLKQAYFNPRLAEEHHRVAKSGKPGEKILDLFTGVGSFALHCAKEYECEVTAIDINPHAIHSLKRSIRRNKLHGEINPIIGDSRKVLQLQRYFDRIIINLPQLAANYLD
ncbi:MAG: class I SAM-dependent methyltransferase [Candidatus Hodarchaeales archaeon]